jgi:hypothetical protein
MESTTKDQQRGVRLHKCKLALGHRRFAWVVARVSDYAQNGGGVHLEVATREWACGPPE